MDKLISKVKDNVFKKRAREIDEFKDRECCLIYIDIKHFSYLGFRYSFHITNKILEIVNNKISKNIGLNDRLDHIYADDFLIISEGPKEKCSSLVCKLREELEKPIFIEQYNISLKLYFTITYVHYPTDFDDIHEAILYLTMLNNYVKKMGIEDKNHPSHIDLPICGTLKKFTDIVFDPNFKEYLIPCFQGIFDLTNNEIYGYEILSRIKHQDEIWEASKFIEILNLFNMNLISDEIIIKKAIEYKCETNDEKMYFFNINPKYFYQYIDMLEKVLSDFKDYNLNTNQICIEFTETYEISNFQEVNNTLKDFKKKHGVMFVIDDFGTGYSNLNAFTTLNFDLLKIDKKLIDQIAEAPFVGYLLKSISELSIYRNIGIIGEGIDSPQKLRLLNKLGFDYAQGYYLQKPFIPQKFLR